MKAAKLINGKISIEEVLTPELSGMGAIIKVEGCGLCGSDIVKVREGKDGAILGHEVVGEIAEINSDTEFKVGDRVVLGHHYPCFECEFCLNESYSMCETFKKNNIFPCGFSEFIYVNEGHLRNTVFKVPDEVESVDISFMEPLACCLRAIGRAEMKTHQSALVIGLGTIGVLMAQAIKLAGYKSYGIDIKEERQSFAQRFGITFEEGIKFDVIFMTSGSSGAISDALRYIKDGGKIVVFSSVADESGYTNNEIYHRELTVLGSYSPSPSNLKLAHKFICEGRIHTGGMSTIYPLDNLSSAIDDTFTNKVFKAYLKI